MTTAPISVERLRELLAKATPGPWIIDTNETYSIRDKDGGRFVLMTHLLGRNGEGGRRSPNEVAATLRLIVAMHEALPALLQQLAEREAEVAFARETLAKALDVGDVSDEPLRTLAIRASNALYWRDQHRQEAERAREEATGLLREAYDTTVMAKPITPQPVNLADRIAAFLAASGGA